ncbi:Centromere protein O [Dillenia turbinata]|uniref:Centromere protein O n=1 Tax=Dillenia turbinata TaxID=194707 RepID=A0AAN8ZUE3_9MAGN
MLFESDRDSDKTIFDRLQREFEAARASQTQEICLDGEQWNDGLLATIRERVICCLEGARIGIQYETFFAGETCELYLCVLESKSFLEKMTVLEHTIPFFLPIREAENDLLLSNAMKFIDHVGNLLQAYVDRREQVRLLQELYGNQIVELYHSLPYHMIEFAFDEFDCKVTVSLKYANLVSVLPTRIRVLAWPMHQNKASPSAPTTSKRGIDALGTQPIPARLTYAEDALRSMSLPEAYAEIIMQLRQALQKLFQPQNVSQ